MVDVELRGKLVRETISNSSAPRVVRSEDDPEGRSTLELTNVLFEAGLSVKLVSWASLDYQFRALHEAQIQDEFQIQNNLLPFRWTLIGARTRPRRSACRTPR